LPGQLQVSSTTVTRALNELVREGLIVRRRRSGSFVADPDRRPLIAGRQLRLGVMLSYSLKPDFEFTSPFHRMVIDGLLSGWGVNTSPAVPIVPETEATRAIWKVPMRGVTVEAVGEEMAARPMHPPIEAIRNGRFDGLIALGIIEKSFIDQVLDLKIPLVLVDFPHDQYSLDADQVYFDPLPGYRNAITHLAAQGARRIHFVGSLLRQPAEAYEQYLTDPDRFNPERGRPDPDSLLRQAAYRQVMTELGLPFSERWMHFTWFGKKYFQAKADELAALPATERPDAVVCHGAEQAQGIMENFAERSLPLAGTGATEVGYLGAALPIFASGKAMGRTAASLMLWKLQSPERASLRVGVPMRCLSTEKNKTESR
jgi:DNA-binding LacI/PurR family transcriptional regulator